MNGIVVVKVGGSAGIDLGAFCAGFAAFVRAGARAVLVHGGSAETDELSRALGHPAVVVRSPSGHVSRRTDRRTLEMFTMACRGRVNAGIVERLQALGVNAVGLSGIDGRLWSGARKGAVRSVEDGRVVIVRDDFTGRVERVNTGLLLGLMELGAVPVLSPPAWADEGVAMNVDADRAAAATAAALGAERLLLLSNVPGLLRDPGDAATVMARVATEPERLAARACAQGRMKNKVLAAEEALGGGVVRVVIGSANGERAVMAAMEGRGTVFERAEEGGEESQAGRLCHLRE